MARPVTTWLLRIAWAAIMLVVMVKLIGEFKAGDPFDYFAAVLAAVMWLIFILSLPRVAARISASAYRVSLDKLFAGVLIVLGLVFLGFVLRLGIEQRNIFAVLVAAVFVAALVGALRALLRGRGKTKKPNTD